MRTKTTGVQESETLHIRVAPEANFLLQEAAREREQSISQFVVESALAKARDVLAVRGCISLNACQSASFTAALDAPPRRHQRMEKLLREPTVLD